MAATAEELRMGPWLARQAAAALRAFKPRGPGKKFDAASWLFFAPHHFAICQMKDAVWLALPDCLDIIDPGKYAP